MAKNEIKVNITAETTQFERNIEKLKNRLKTAFEINALTLSAVNPFAAISQGIGNFIKGALNDLVDSFKNWRKGLEDISSATERTAKDLDTTTLQASRLEAAALAEYLPSFARSTARPPPHSPACASSHRTDFRVPVASPAQAISKAPAAFPATTTKPSGCHKPHSCTHG